ncbi:phage terminase small subunit [Paenibacillus sinopodophylli]|uniref:phage terminase small subunit n=1 Tax=Paenibacillus sinopodophylli TaxID=1837342 RepID=UPI00110CA64B|nr:phage terminase small subunit [Paenibacillus sinopodophylli]
MDWVKIRQSWETSTISFKDIADEYGIKDATIRSRKNREGWQRNNATQRKRNVATNGKKARADASKRKGAGNPDPPNQFAKRNSAAVTHGLFQKYMPAESLEIMEQLQQQSPLDIVWDNIMIQYTAIIRAQQIMYVKDREDQTKVDKKLTDTGIEYEIQHAWDKQATFLQAQSRAMSTLQSLIRQYDDLLRTELATEEQKARIDVLKSKVPNKDGVDPNAQITALADLINNPAPERVLDDD